MIDLMILIKKLIIAHYIVNWIAHLWKIEKHTALVNLHRYINVLGRSNYSCVLTVILVLIFVNIIKVKLQRLWLIVCIVSN